MIDIGVNALSALCLCFEVFCWDMYVANLLVMCRCSVLIIDDAQKDADKKIVMEFTFVQPVMSVRLRMDRYIN